MWRLIAQFFTNIHFIFLYTLYFLYTLFLSSFSLLSCRPHNLIFHSTLSLFRSAHLWAYPFIPDLLHPSNPHLSTSCRKRKRESFSTGKSHPVGDGVGGIERGFGKLSCGLSSTEREREKPVWLIQRLWSYREEYCVGVERWVVSSLSIVQMVYGL